MESTQLSNTEVKINSIYDILLLQSNRIIKLDEKISSLVKIENDRIATMTNI